MFSPEMMKTASEMMSKLSPEDLSRMSEMAGGMNSKQDFSSLLGGGGMPTDPAMLRSMFKVCKAAVFPSRGECVFSCAHSERLKSAMHCFEQKP